MTLSQKSKTLMAKNSQLVYSSDTGRVQRLQKSQKKKTQQKQQSATTKDGSARVRLEKKGRGGKTVTTVSGLPLGATELKALASDLKRKCGSGGSIVDGVIDIQGDNADAVIAELAKAGYQAKRAGG